MQCDTTSNNCNNNPYDRDVLPTQTPAKNQESNMKPEHITNSLSNATSIDAAQGML